MLGNEPSFKRRRLNNSQSFHVPIVEPLVVLSDDSEQNDDDDDLILSLWDLDLADGEIVEIRKAKQIANKLYEYEEDYSDFITYHQNILIAPLINQLSVTNDIICEIASYSVGEFTVCPSCKEKFYAPEQDIALTNERGFHNDNVFQWDTVTGSYFCSNCSKHTVECHQCSGTQDKRKAKECYAHRDFETQEDYCRFDDGSKCNAYRCDKGLGCFEEDSSDVIDTCRECNEWFCLACALDLQCSNVNPIHLPCCHYAIEDIQCACDNHPNCIGSGWFCPLCHKENNIDANLCHNCLNA
eukprot:99827_1